MSQLHDQNPRERFTGALWAALTTALVWLRGDDVTDDRGSDSSEKAFMVILAIALGGAVTAAAVAFVASKTVLFQ